jgi:D-psicose/D-tagatose/L-ribulose 3-epimerase
MSGAADAKIRIGVSVFVWARQFGPAMVPVLGQLRDQGLDALEVPMFDPRDVDAPGIRRELEKNGLECTVCAILPPAVNPISPDERMRAQARDYLAECVRKTSEMGGRLLCGPVYAPIGYLQDRRGTEQEWDWAVTCLQQLGDVLDECEVDLAIEPVNRAETFFLRKASEAAELCERVQHRRIGITLDTFHANIEEKTLAGAVRDCSGLLRHVHASENDRGRLGSGHVDFRGMVSELRASGYSGYLMIEGFGYSPRVPDSLAAMVGVHDGTPEEVAFGGARFLRQLVQVVQAG